MSGLFRHGNAAVPQKLKGMRVQSSLYGTVIPILSGRSRIPGNLIGYEDFAAVKQKAQGGKGGLFGGGGKGGGFSYLYSAAVLIGLCAGKIASIFDIYDTAGLLQLNTVTETFTVPGGGGSHSVTHASTFYGDYGVTRGDSYSFSANDYGSPGSTTFAGTNQTPMTNVGASPNTGEYTVNAVTGAYGFAAGDAGKVVSITYSYSTTQTGSSTNTPPITLANFSIFKGAQGQTAWSYMTTNHPTRALGYTALGYVASQKLNLGSSGALPNMSFEVWRPPDVSSLGIKAFNNGSGDSNPRDVLLELLIDPLFGLDYPIAEIADWSSYSNFCLANGLLVSPVFDSDQPAAEWIKQITEATNSEVFTSQGLLKIAPYGDTTAVGNGVTYSPATTPIYDLTDDDFIRDSGQDPIVVVRPTITDRFNNVKVEFLNRANAYNPEIVEEFDQSSIENYRKRQTSPTQMHFFANQGAAQTAANMQLKRLVYIVNQYQFKLDRRYVLLDPMDLVTLTDPVLGFNKKPARILEMKEDKKTGNFAILAEDFPWGAAAPTAYPKQAATPFIPASDADPGAVNAPILFEAQSRLNDQIGHSIYMGLSGASANWGGCSVWISTDGATYKKVGVQFAKSRMGTLTTSLASHADPDTVDSFNVDLGISAGQLFSGVAADADNFRTLCYVDGELVSYQDATLVSGNVYTLGTRLRRGIAGSTIGAHGIGTSFLRIDENVFEFDFDPTLVGTTVHFKFTSFNLTGNMEQPLANATDYTIAVTGASLGLLTPAHASYRPLNSDTTGHDAGASATINIAADSMRVPGQPDIPFNSGAVTGLSYNTLYFVYYDDPAWRGGSVIFQVTTTKEAALNAAGRFFVESITTPRAGAPDTIGNSDGGSGAQTGMLTIFSLQSQTNATSGTGSSISNGGNVTDGDATSFATLQASGGTGVINSASLTFAVAPAILNRRWKSLTMKILAEVSQNNLSPSSGHLAAQITVQGPISWTPITLNQGGGTIAKTLYSQSIPVSTNLSLLSAIFSVFAEDTNTTGAVVMKSYEAWIEAVE